MDACSRQMCHLQCERTSEQTPNVMGVGVLALGVCLRGLALYPVRFWVPFHKDLRSLESAKHVP